MFRQRKFANYWKFETDIFEKNQIIVNMYLSLHLIIQTLFIARMFDH